MLNLEVVTKKQERSEDDINIYIVKIFQKKGSKDFDKLI